MFVVGTFEFEVGSPTAFEREEETEGVRIGGRELGRVGI